MQYSLSHICTLWISYILLQVLPSQIFNQICSLATPDITSFCVFAQGLWRLKVLLWPIVYNHHCLYHSGRRGLFMYCWVCNYRGSSLITSQQNYIDTIISQQHFSVLTDTPVKKNLSIGYLESCIDFAQLEDTPPSLRTSLANSGMILWSKVF